MLFFNLLIFSTVQLTLFISGTLQQAVRFPVTRIPPEATNYFCMLFDLPSDGDYHLVATTPIINNSASLHHMILFGCQLPGNSIFSFNLDGVFYIVLRF